MPRVKVVGLASLAGGAVVLEPDADGAIPCHGDTARLVASFDGLGVGFSGPQGTTTLRNPSDNSLAVGRGRVLYGAVETRNVFKDFGGRCELRNNGEAVVRYDQLANRWLIVMPIFSRVPKRADDPAPGRDGEPARQSHIGIGYSFGSTPHSAGQ